MEVLLVSSLIAVLAIAVFRSFGNGLKLWGKAERLNREAEVAIFLDKMSEDLRSTVITSGLFFKGTGMQVSFPAIVLTPADVKSARKEEGLIDQIGEVQYRFDGEQHVILRRQSNYSQALKGKWVQEEAAVVRDVDELNFHYEIVSNQGIRLLKSEIREGVPAGIMVEVRFSDDNGPHQLKRFLPVFISG
jgi:hypothetical protein